MLGRCLSLRRPHVMHGQRRSDDDGRERAKSCNTAKEEGASAAFLPVALPCRELVTQEVDCFVIADLVEPQADEFLFQWLQRRPVQPSEELLARQQHTTRIVPRAAPRR